MKTLDEMMEEMNSGLTTKIKMSYQLEKSMKKIWGKHRAYEISVGRKLVKMIREKYGRVL